VSISRLTAAIALPALIAAAPLAGQSVSDVPVAPAPAASVEAATSANAADCNCLVIPALTPIELFIDANLGSKISKSADTFPIRLAKPIIVDGQEVLAVGFVGQGEVVHAKKAGGSGAAGELVLAARYLTIGDRRLKLRSMRLSTGGKDSINSVTAVSVLAVGVFGFAMTGGNITVASGSNAVANTAEVFSLPKASAKDQPSTTAQVSKPVVQETRIKEGN
jgi:hypothetical protein